MIPQTTSEEAVETLRRDPKAVYLDVRSDGEFAAGHPAGAYNVPVMFFDAERRPNANPDFVAVVTQRFPTEATILVGCQSGVRSQHAAEMLAAHGFREVRNVQGGFGGSPAARGWRDSGLPVETGQPADRGYEALRRKS